MRRLIVALSALVIAVVPAAPARAELYICPTLTCVASCPHDITSYCQAQIGSRCHTNVSGECIAGSTCDYPYNQVECFGYPP